MATRFLSASDLEDELVAVRAKLAESRFALNEAFELIKQAEPSIHTDLDDGVRFRRAIENQLSSVAAYLEELARDEQPEVRASMVMDDLDELLELVRVAGSTEGDDGS